MSKKMHKIASFYFFYTCCRFLGGLLKEPPFKKKDHIVLYLDNK